jgi:hypothetical protein
VDSGGFVVIYQLFRNRKQSAQPATYLSRSIGTIWMWLGIICGLLGIIWGGLGQRIALSSPHPSLPIPT